MEETLAEAALVSFFCLVRFHSPVGEAIARQTLRYRQRPGNKGLSASATQPTDLLTMHFNQNYDL
jgi:hypothetical protein